MNFDSIACPGYRMSRRTFAGAAAGLFLGMNVRTLVARSGEDHKATAEHVILFWNGGGMSHIDTLDPKPGRADPGRIRADQDLRHRHRDLGDLPATGQADEARGVDPLHRRHRTAITAGPPINCRPATPKAPTSSTPASARWWSASGKTLGRPAGLRHGQRPGPQGRLPRPEVRSLFRRPARREGSVPGVPRAASAKSAATSGSTSSTKINKKQADSLPSEETRRAQTALTDAVKLMRSPALEAFEVRKEKPEVLERYGDSEFGRSALLARRLVEKGVRFVQVNRGGFDVHSNAFPAMRDHGEVMDPALAALIEDLAQSGMLKKTMIVMLSEFGRTPKINMTMGRDHHPGVFSCIFAGGGVKGGQVIGSSDEDGVLPKDRPVKVSHLHASICHALGIDSEQGSDDPAATADEAGRQRQAGRRTVLVS